MISDVAALYVDARGPYPSHVADWYDVKRDARAYAGSLPVVAHPPCQRWCRLAGLVQSRWGHRVGDDGGLFAHALAEVRRVGGVLEHPAYSLAWDAHDLPRPITGAGWCAGADDDEWTCYVEQFRYGHMAKKATWLYYCGSSKPFRLRWGVLDDHAASELQPVSWAGNKGRTNWRDNVRPVALVSYLSNNGGRDLHRKRLTKKQARSTPPEFLAELIKLARWSVWREKGRVAA